MRRPVGLISSRFGRRMFVLFVTCALVPIAALAILSSLRVTGELHEQARQRLYHATRAVGMDVVDRLTGVELELRELDPTLPGPLALRRLTERLRGLTYLPSEGRPRVILGKKPIAFDPDATVVERLLSGGTWLETRGADASTTVRLAVPARDGTWIASLDPGFLFRASVEEHLPPGSEFCVFSGATRLRCTVADATPPERPEQGDSLVAWQPGETRYLTVPWTLFLKAGFGAEGWLLVVAEPEAQVLAPIATFRATLALVTLLAVLMVALLSAVQIRRRLVPLTQLHDGTQRIAGGDFGRPVTVASGDELEDLATAFNHMAGRLDLHVRGLERVIGLDRSFLEARDEADLTERFLERLDPIYRADVALVAITSDAESGPFRVHARHANGRIERLEAPGVTCEQQIGLRTEPFLRIPLGRLPDRYAGLVEDATRGTMCFPLWSEKFLEGVVIAIHDTGAEPEREQALHARQLCDQLTSALRGTRLRQQNERLRAYDPMTGLRNRRGFAEALESCLAACTADRVVVMRISLDGVGRLTERFGTAESDRLVSAMARALEGAPDSAAARLDASDFAVALTGLQPRAIQARVRQVLVAIEDLVGLDQRHHSVSVRAGVSVYPIDGEDGDQLLHQAETALGHARREARAGAVFFSDELDVAAQAMARLEADIQTGLDEGQFHVHYQPIVDVESRLCMAAEALVRWEHPERGAISPTEFIPVAEESGLIGVLGRFVLRQVCEEAGRWFAEGTRPIRMHVNVSGLQLAEGNFFSEVQSALLGTPLAAEHLCLELTESVLLSEELGVIECLRAIRRMGVTISIDDFGTGYSSLGYLKRFPIETLKVDRSFITEVAHDRDDRAITEAVIGMAHGLGLSTVAEGVENEEQLAVLRQCHCDLAQGYLFGAAMAGDAFRKLLDEHEG